MPKRLGRRRPVAPVGAFVALAMFASACGSETAESGSAATTAPAPAPASTDATTAATTDAAGEAPVSEGPAAPVNLFAPVDVVRIDDGTTVNLANELGGGELPVLLWFWAPH